MNNNRFLLHIFANGHVFINVFYLAFSEGADDVALQCPSIKHNIDIKEIKVEDGQVCIN